MLTSPARCFGLDVGWNGLPYYSVILKHLLIACRRGRAGRVLGFHSITSSARPSSCGGTVTPRAFSGFEVDHQFELGRLFHRDVGWLRPAQNLVSKIGGTPVQVQEARPVGQQPFRFDELANVINRWQQLAQRQGVDVNSVSGYQRVVTDIKCVRAAVERLEDGRNILRVSDFVVSYLEPKRASRCLNLGISSIAGDTSALAIVAKRCRSGTISRKSSSRLPARSVA
jgi:hypothetical protein